MLIIKCIGFILLFISILYSQNEWIELNIPNCNRNFWRMIEGHDSTIFVKCGEKQIYYSIDEGKSWSKMPLNFKSSPTNSNEFGIFAIATDSLYRFYVGGWTGKIFRTSDFGLSWDSLKVDQDKIGYIWDIEIISNKIYAIAGRDFYFSPDFGQSWITQDSVQEASSFEDIAVGKNGLLFIADYFNGIHKSTDNGKNWTLSDSGLTYPYCRSVFIYNDSTVLTGTDGAGVWKSLDNGESWTQCSQENSPTREVYHIYKDSDGSIYAQGDSPSWVSVSSDLGDSWIILPKAPGVYTSLLLDSKDQLYLATTEGLFFMNSFIVSNIQLDKRRLVSFKLDQNYPNPFNPTTTITYELPVSNKVTLTVYDVLGREVKTLVNKKQTTGKYKVTFDGQDLPSGVYLYVLKTEQATQTRKMILLR